MEVLRSENIALGLLIITLVICLYYLVLNFFPRRKSIPGPLLSVPIFGYLPFLGKESYKDLFKLADKYGPLFSFYLGRQKVVIISDYKILKEATANPSLLGRPSYTIFNLMPDGIGFASESGLSWQELRKYSMSTLKKLTAKANPLEELVQEDPVRTMDHLKEMKGEPLQIRDRLTDDSINTIWYYMFGEKLVCNTSKRHFLITLIDVMAEYFGLASPCGFLPWLPKVFATFKIRGYDKALSVLKNANMMFGKEVDQKKSENTSDPEMFVSRYLSIMDASKDEQGNTTFTIGRLLGTLQVFFLGSSETTRSSIEWVLYAIVEYLDVQNRIQNEIDSVIGRERTIKWSDRSDLPYTMAVITELQRWRTLVPIPAPRCALDDTTLNGYHVGKGTVIMTNLWAIHNDKNYWDCPEEFRPERFLSNDGKKFVKRESYAPFNLGRRMCPGSEMALVIIFIYVSTILQKFNVRTPGGNHIDLDSHVFGLTFQPLQQKLCFIPRE